MPNPLFDSNSYCGFLNLLNTSCFLTLGVPTGSTPNNPFETGDSFSSKNWQLFHQDPIYFIRNHDHVAEHQSTIPSTNSSLP
jgi:hypothetical protein